MEPTFATNFFHRALSGEPPAAPGRHTCAVCGLPTTSETRVQTVLRPTFTDIALLRRPESRHVCPACAWYFDHQEVRRANWWLAADGATEIARGDLRRVIDEQLATPPAADGYLLITVSKRKHIALRAPLNLAGSHARRVQFETDTLTLHAADWFRLTAAVDALRVVHTWQEILADNYQSWRVGRWANVAEFVAARAVARPYLRTPYLDIVKFVSVVGQKDAGDTGEDHDTD